MNIGSVQIGMDQPCRFIAELSNNHNGDLARAYRLIDAAKASGAAFVKFQCYTTAELIALRGDGPAPEPWGSQGYTMATLYQRAATPFAWFPELFAYARNIGIEPFSSVFGPDSLALLESLDCPAYKIARLDNGHVAFVQMVQRRNKPVLVSAARGEAIGYPLPDALLYCAPGYPTPPSEMRLPREFDGTGMGYVGISSHCVEAYLEVAVAAVARGAKIIEMHMMLDDEPSDLEASVSLTATQFRLMVETVRRTEEVLG